MRDIVGSLTPITSAKSALLSPNCSAARTVALVKTAAGSGVVWGSAVMAILLKPKADALMLALGLHDSQKCQSLHHLK
jgi:hypothetical protein